MSMYDYAKTSKFSDEIRKMHGAEVNGSSLYFVLITIAKEKGLNDLADAMLKNACEDALHGGMYGAMLGKGHENDEEFWRQVVKLYKLEASAEESLRRMADEMRAAGEPKLAACVESTIEEENNHAERLRAVFDAHGITY
ncbi:MAG: DUF892 family protein [Desulfovibrionaceae bacterium]|nr:DUF892 family protein [Desulfovibrionaceae bacterium]